MKGNNEMRLCLSAVQEIFQRHFDEALFQAEAAVVIASISLDTSNTSGPALVVKFTGKPVLEAKP